MDELARFLQEIFVGPDVRPLEPQNYVRRSNYDESLWLEDDHEEDRHYRQNCRRNQEHLAVTCRKARGRLVFELADRASPTSPSVR